MALAVNNMDGRGLDSNVCHECLPRYLNKKQQNNAV